ncbi:hypothetical protein T4D_15281 [Trichinella pseudospiralis]|uniref:Uncharacterized protein n=1 Tax=Trichinella pseudospiralis TaxID=6337 RepID=A0A0V1F424_TRIPS|nr:hypothetical protein T4D_15281 [Trichinella pseudospiralis]
MEACPEWDLKYLKQTNKSADFFLLFGHAGSSTLPDPKLGKS